MLDKTPTLWDIAGSELLGWFFIEFPGFTQYWRQYFSDDSDYSAFQGVLAKTPQSGDAMPGCGGLRKVRWADARRGKGKRGGLRVVYQIIPQVQVIVLVEVYDKDEADDLTAEEKKHLARLAKATESELIKKMQKRGAK
jgi:mRNA-degrading endonuclease RelE of RelBE toxin-antitoxin system